MYNLIITEYNNKVLSAVYEEGKMVEVSLEDKEASSIIGNIYIGRVESVITNINAAFIELMPGIKGYYSLADNPNPIFLNKKNSNKVCQGDRILVQVERDAVKTKAAIVTSNINIHGKYVAFSLNDKGVSVSSKIGLKQKKKAIKEKLSELCTGDFGLVGRTNCEELFLDNEFHFEPMCTEAIKLINEFNDILQKAPFRMPCTIIRQSPPDYVDAVINARTEDLNQVITDSESIYSTLVDNLINDKNLISKIRKYEDKLLPLNKLYSVESQLGSALKSNIWLKSGGYLVIEPTEALTVIDVNTGKCTTSKGKKDDTFFKVNKEAAKEIALQLRLRNYSGIIIIDFIDMESYEYNQELIELLKSEIQKDRIMTTFVDMTKLGLVELTRKKVKKPLHEQL